MASIILYNHKDFQGENRVLTDSEDGLADFQISSFKVQEGNWKFSDLNGKELAKGRVFNPGEEISWVPNADIPDNTIDGVELDSEN